MCRSEPIPFVFFGAVRYESLMVGDDRSDEQLLCDWRAGDSRSGDQLFSRHFETARRHVINRVDSEDDIKELMSQAFLICVEARDHVESFLPYLLGIIRHLVFKYWSARARGRAHLDFEECSIADLCSSPSSVAARSVRERRVLDALRRLPLRQQIALELFYWERLTGRQLGEVLGVPEATARSLLLRAKEAFGREVRRMENFDRVPESTDDNLEKWARRIHERATDGEEQDTRAVQVVGEVVEE